MKRTAKKTLMVLRGMPTGYPATAAPKPGNVKRAHKIIHPSIRSPIYFELQEGTWSTNLAVCSFNTIWRRRKKPTGKLRHYACRNYAEPGSLWKA